MVEGAALREYKDWTGCLVKWLLARFLQSQEGQVGILSGQLSGDEIGVFWRTLLDKEIEKIGFKH